MAAILNFAPIRRIFRAAPASAAASAEHLRSSRLRSRLAAHWLRDVDGRLVCEWAPASELRPHR
jgi:hypothetical protein